MSHKLSKQELAAVVTLPDVERFEYLAKRVADREEIWSLKDPAGGWCLYGSSDGRECVPVWPLTEFARACATGDWERYEPAAIPIEKWLSSWEHGLARDGRLVAVFPTPNSTSAPTIEPLKFNEAIRCELSRIE